MSSLEFGRLSFVQIAHYVVVFRLNNRDYLDTVLKFGEIFNNAPIVDNLRLFFCSDSCLSANKEQNTLHEN